MEQMYKVFVKQNLLYIADAPIKNVKDFKKVNNIEFVDDAVFVDLLPLLEQEYEEPVCYCLHSPDPVFLWRRFRKQYKLVIAGGGLVRNHKSKVLFIFRNGRWDLPKGKAEAGELVEETALREVKEECGLNDLIMIGHIIDTYHTYDLKGSRKLKKTSWYAMHSTDKDLIPQAEEGITKIKWIKEDKMERIFANTYPSIVEVLAAERKKDFSNHPVKISHKNMSLE